jgi:hypothetical protein
MTETNRSSSSYATRWDTLLAEHSILHKAHLDLLSSFTLPFSAQQTAQLEASAARFESLPPKIQQLVEDWANTHLSFDRSLYHPLDPRVGTE